MPNGSLAPRSLVLLAALTLTTSAGHAQATTPTATAQRSAKGLDPQRVARIDQALQGYVDRNEVAGAVALVLRDGRVAYERSVGWADKEAGRKMTPDAIFRIASQSKAVTSAALLLLYEQGKVSLYDPVSKYIPSFAQTTVMNPDGSTVPAKRAVTVFDLLTHTAGISYGTDPSVAKLYEARGMGPAAGYGWYTADKDEPICTTMERLGTLPFVAQPGERFVYGYNTDILGCLVERISGQTLDEFVGANITGPLRMTDTHYFLAPEQRSRLTTVYASKSDGTIERAPDGAKGQGHYVDGPRRSFSGGAGLLSTARDYARFLQMTLNDGQLDGVRVLAPHTVRLMKNDQLGATYGQSGKGFGLGFETVGRYGASGMSSVGTYGWGGAYGTWYSVDPQERLVIVLMIQLMPNGSSLRDRFANLVYQALVN
ncbi:MAG: serine hydrolase domain-containing protein [Gemmatimonadaceae bacterium]